MIARVLLFVVMLLGCSSTSRAETSVTTETLRLTFDDSGNLRSAIACFPACAGENPRIQQFGDDSVLEFEPRGAGSWSQSQMRSDEFYVLEFEHGSGSSVSWRIPVRGYRVGLGISGIDAISIRSGESFQPREAAGFGNWLEQSRYVLMEAGEVSHIGFDDTDAEAVETDHWVGYRNRYWSLLADPPQNVRANLATGENRQDAMIGFESPHDGNWMLYLGPLEPNVLKTTDESLSHLMYAGLWFWLRWICFGMFYLLAWLSLVIPSWGLAVMCMSLIVNILMYPLSRIAERFQQEVNEIEARLAPELGHIKKNYKGEEQAAKILALYKTERVHPLYSLKSMMGVAVVIPVFIGAFDMLAENIHLLNTGFLWISDLSRPDDLFRLPLRLPFFGAEFNLLPFLMTGLSVVASALHNPLSLDAGLRRKQVRNMVLLAIAFFVLFYTFPAGMVLYWTTNNLISVIKSLWARR